MDKADEVLRSIERLSERRFLPIIDSHKGTVLVDTIRKVKPKRILEVGTLIGYSTILMGKELGGDAEIIMLEIHEEEAREAEKNIRKSGIRPKVSVVVGDALETIPNLAGPFDMVFIDASKNEYLDYLKLVEDKLHKGSVVVADNAGIFADEMNDYLDYVRNSGRYESKSLLSGEDGVEVSIKL